MWQHHYILSTMRTRELRAEAERERRWRLQDEANGRQRTARSPGRARAATARLVAAASRGTARIARRLDERMALEVGPEILARDA